MSSTDLPSLLTATASPKASAVRVAPGERLRSVRLPGITLSVRSRPPAREGLPPALYVHGLGGSSQNWSALMPLLDGLVESEALDEVSRLAPEYPGWMIDRQSTYRSLSPPR